MHVGCRGLGCSRATDRAIRIRFNGHRTTPCEVGQSRRRYTITALDMVRVLLLAVKLWIVQCSAGLQKQDARSTEDGDVFLIPRLNALTIVLFSCHRPGQKDQV